MALADDFFSFAASEGAAPASAALEQASDAPESFGGVTASEETRAAGAGTRKVRPSKVRKTADKVVEEDEGRLAKMVRELRGLEDTIVEKLGEADRLFSQLESRRTHEDGGYGTAEEFEERMLASAPLLRSMREAAPAPTRTRLVLAKREAAREASEGRARQTKALTAIARTLERVRTIDSELRQSASAARTKLHRIESKKIYDDCGYPSFEEFLERALGPSPVLASAVALVADDPLQPSASEAPPADAAASAPPGESDGHDFEPVFAQDAEGSGEPEATAPAEQGADGGPAVEEEAAATQKRSRKRILFSVILCALAAVGGAAVGTWTDRATQATAPAGAPAPAAVPGEAAHPKAAEHPATKAEEAPVRTRPDVAVAAEQRLARAGTAPAANAPLEPHAAAVAPHAAEGRGEGKHAVH